jgi:selenocysteine lyase/cysteine desulfurase
MNYAVDRRTFLSNIGKGVGLATLSSTMLSAMESELSDSISSFAGQTPESLAGNEDFWGPIQQSFSVGRGTINLNNGGVSPSPKIVTEALVRYQWQQEDTTAFTMWQVMQPQLETVRTGIAELFGCSREEIAITRNASESLEIVLLGMDLKKGDEVLTTTQDYPRMLSTLRQRELRDGIVPKYVKIPVPVKNKQEILDIFAKGITPKTKAILLCHQINLTGQILPVKEIVEMAKTKGIEVIVDGAHSFAQFDFMHKDVGCDYFGVSLHKWLYAPKGTGFLYVNKEKIEKLWPLMAAEKPKSSDIRKFEEIGTHSIAPKLAIGEAVTYHRLIGGKRKEERLRYLSKYWMNLIKNAPNVYFNTPISDDAFCALGNFGIKGIDPLEIGGYLQSKHKIYTTPIIHDEFKGIRITPNLYTTTSELDRFSELITEIATNGIPK